MGGERWGPEGWGPEGWGPEGVGPRRGGGPKISRVVALLPCCCCVVVTVCRRFVLLCVCVVGVFRAPPPDNPPPDNPPPDPPSAGPPSAGPPSAGRPKISLFFFPSPATVFILFSFSCWSFSLNFGSVFEDRDPQMCTFGLSGCRVKLAASGPSVDFGLKKREYPTLRKTSVHLRMGHIAVTPNLGDKQSATKEIRNGTPHPACYARLEQAGEGCCHPRSVERFADKAAEYIPKPFHPVSFFVSGLCSAKRPNKSLGCGAQGFVLFGGRSVVLRRERCVVKQGVKHDMRSRG